MFGDVYVCSGQSNMQFTVHSVFNATEEIAQAAKFPQIRLFSVGTQNISLTPVPELIHYDLGWSVASPDVVGKADWSYFSAVCWFYGKYLAETYPTLPIGLISTNWGGTYVQAWSSPDALRQCPDLPVQVAEYDSEFGAPNPNQPSVLWNAMIVPFLKNPIKGALWYQGEQNSGDPAHYGCFFKAMITDWRAKWADGKTNFPFLFVQLAPWTPGSVTIPETRQAQLDALALPNVGFATAVDLGDIDSPYGNIHPRDKEDVGRRLLLAGRAIAYGDTTIIFKGPMASKFQVATTTPTASVTVTFENDTISGGLVLHPEPQCPTNADCAWYEIQLGTTSVRATAALRDKNVLTISVANAANAKITGVRYAWAPWPMCNLYNGAGLPAIPFSYYFPN
jgi:sialate O-acetylesterase